MNSVYDPDYTTGGGSCSGFTAYSLMYNYYRVDHFSIDVDIANQENFPVMFIMAPVSGSFSGDPLDLAEMPYAKKGVLSAKGGQDRLTLKYSTSIAALVGSKTALLSDNYASQVTTNPAYTALMTLAINCDGGAVLTNGVFGSIRVKYRVIFYKRQNLDG